MSAATWQRADLVPLALRQRYLDIFRTLAAIAAVAWSAVSPVEQQVRVSTSEVAIIAIFLTVSVVVGSALSQAGRRTRPLFGATLLLDGAAMIVLVQLHGGAVSPLRYLPLLHLVVVTLIVSHRTGVKLAIWHSLLLLLWSESIDVGLLSQAAAPTGLDVAVAVGLLWFTTLVTALASAVNEREILRRRYDLDALASMAAELERTSDLHHVARILVDRIADTFDAPRVAVLSLRDGDPLMLAGRGLRPASSTGAVVGVLAEVRETQRTLLVSELGDGDRWLSSQLDDARHLSVVPLVTSGEVNDVLLVEHGSAVGARVEQRVIATIERFASQGALALHNARLHAELVALAQTDGLTGTANRPAFDRTLAAELARVSRHGGEVALLLCDLDHFKRVNDEHGHQTGDAALSWVASQLQLGSREYDLVARYGGEEFAVVMPATDVEAAAAVAERLREAIEQGDSPVPLTVSVGVAASKGQAAPADLVRDADEALYDAKHAGRNQVARHRGPGSGSAGRDAL